MTDDRRQAPITVYYDASCPLCAGEMDALKARDATGALALVDCSTLAGDDTSAHGPVTRRAMMESLHVRTPDGRWRVGVDAYEAVFTAMGFTRLARVAAHPRLLPLWNRLYASVARHRHRLPRHGLARLLSPFAARTPRRPHRTDRHDAGAA